MGVNFHVANDIPRLAALIILQSSTGGSEETLSSGCKLGAPPLTSSKGKVALCEKNSVGQIKVKAKRKIRLSLAS